VKPKTKIFGLFRCFEHILKQLKQTELFRNKSKQTELTLNFLNKIPKYALYQTVSVALLLVSVQSKHRNSLFRYRSETSWIVPKLWFQFLFRLFRIETSFEGHPRCVGTRHPTWVPCSKSGSLGKVVADTSHAR
jgi:hypothetical protein